MRINQTATEARDVYRRLPFHGGTEPGWMSGGFGMHRDSEPLEESNYFTALARYRAAGVDVREDRFGHFAVGWIDELTVPITRAAVVVLSELRDAVDSYPVLDDEDFSEREWSDNHPSEDECYSEDRDCPCGRKGEGE